MGLSYFLRMPGGTQAGNGARLLAADGHASEPSSPQPKALRLPRNLYLTSAIVKTENKSITPKQGE